MANRIADIPRLLMTPLGRRELRRGALHRAWPVLSRLARWHRRTLAQRCTVIVVVGSFGKTTTVRALRASLGQSDVHLGYNAWSSVAREMLAIRPRDRHAVIEVGIDDMGQMRLYEQMIRPDVVVVTSIGSEHHRSLLTLENTRDEKAEMLRGLGERGCAVGNGDDPNVRWMLGQTRAPTVTFGWEPGNDVRASDLELDWPSGSRFVLHAHGKSHPMKVHLVGRAMVNSILASAAVTVALDLPLAPALERLESLTPTTGRLEPVRLSGDVMLLRDDFKSSLETVDEALDVLATIPATRRQVVLGDISEPPGSQGPIYRRIGERVAQIADRAVFMGTCVQRYSAGAARAGLDRARIVDGGGTAKSALEALKQDLRAGDVVLIKGRDTQRLDRISLELEGRSVGCERTFCDARPRCADCVVLETGAA